jgi:hypothetical protein
MRFLILAAAAGAVVLPAGAASAQYYGGNGYGYDNRVRQEQRECRRELRRSESRREYYRELRECQREIAEARRHQYRRGEDRYGYGDRYDRDRRYWDGYRWRDRY